MRPATVRWSPSQAAVGKAGKRNPRNDATLLAMTPSTGLTVSTLAMGCWGGTATTQGWAMTEPKEHHFVPQFYLKNFGQGKSIRLFNFERQKHIPGAPIKSQCARSKLHAFSPGLEQKLSVLEGQQQQQSVLSWRREPHRPVGVRRGRTPLGFWSSRSCGPRAMQSVDTLADFMLEHAPEAGMAVEGPDREQLKPHWAHPLALLFKFLKEVFGHATDLGMHLLVNGTNEGFITCDDPVVLHNQYCEGIEHMGVVWMGQFRPPGVLAAVAGGGADALRRDGVQGLRHRGGCAVVNDYRRPPRPPQSMSFSFSTRWKASIAGRANGRLPGHLWGA